VGRTANPLSTIESRIVNNPAKKVSEALSETLTKLRGFIKNTLADDKPELTDIYDELQNVLYLVTAEYAANQEALNTVNNLREKLVELQNWKETKSKYSLIKLTMGVLVYAPNKTHESPEPLHWICANCFSDQKKSILQLQKHETPDNRSREWPYYLDCPRCKTSLKIDTKDFQALRTQ